MYVSVTHLVPPLELYKVIVTHYYCIIINILSHYFCIGGLLVPIP
jgi:hypothetical protein